MTASGVNIIINYIEAEIIKSAKAPDCSTQEDQCFQSWSDKEKHQRRAETKEQE